MKPPSLTTTRKSQMSPVLSFRSLVLALTAAALAVTG